MANPMRPVATAEARVIQVRTVRAGESVSYGRALKLDRDSRLAIVSAGYADGYMRSQSSGGVRSRAPSAAFLKATVTSALRSTPVPELTWPSWKRNQRPISSSRAMNCAVRFFSFSRAR